ncbi:glycosyltransferase family 2 protein [Carboxylicivirga marina]|uniref:Glycosyltransferase family 2 protein n=1 Tax=Carboxylicivirga marina TaxID=2800988 RepID=A0ABS1HJ74_9BACT|nr:glycosyltransferase [Carboxylicivirga marina]MBK3517676.1 glycosyltransferase family 2 protein [Carboxylicivirga marina]
MIDCTILILTYKGKHHLKELLPSVKDVIENTTGYNIDVLIVDNGKDEITKSFVEENYPDYRYEFSPVNDYLFSLNSFVQNTTSPFTFILNDDMRLDKNVLNECLPIIWDDPSIFSVNCKLLNWDGKGAQNSVRILKYQNGWASSQWLEEDEEDNEVRYTLYGGGGSAIFRTEMFNKIGGFNQLYRPAYAEDLDLSHEAWHRGWKSVFVPRAIIYHRDGATIKEQYANQNDKLTQRINTNKILWMLKNCNEKNFLIYFLIKFPFRLLFDWRIDRNHYKALWFSLKKIPLAIKLRNCDYEFNDKIIRERYLNQPYKPQ